MFVYSVTGEPTFSGEMRVRIYGLDHTLSVVMEYQPAGCWVGPVSATLTVTTPQRPMSPSEFMAVGAADAVELAAATVLFWDRLSHLHATCHAPGAALYFAPMLIGC